MSRRVLIAVLFVLCAGQGLAQGVLGDVFSGKLINPEPGVWSWYQVTDKAGTMQYVLRQAIVGKEEVKRKEGFWVETELRPQAGFPTVFKMLLTGPASDPKNVHQMIVKDGTSAPQSVPVPQEGYTPSNEGGRTLVGDEKIKIGNGEEVAAQHFTIGDGAAQADVWLSDAVRPLGIVKMSSSEGEMLLQRYGAGGPDGDSVISAYSEGAAQENGKVKVEVRVNGEKRDAAPMKKDDAKPAPAPAAKDDAATPKPAKKSKKTKEN